MIEIVPKPAKESGKADEARPPTSPNLTPSLNGAPTAETVIAALATSPNDAPTAAESMTEHAQ
jgi:hypothetical protein